MKVAYYSPMPPSRSGIADYSALLLPELERRIDVAVAQPGRFKRAPAADVALYHVGNDADAHGWIVEALRRRAEAGGAAGKAAGARPETAPPSASPAWSSCTTTSSTTSSSV